MYDISDYTAGGPLNFDAQISSPYAYDTRDMNSNLAAAQLRIGHFIWNAYYSNYINCYSIYK